MPTDPIEAKTSQKSRKNNMKKAAYIIFLSILSTGLWAATVYFQEPDCEDCQTKAIAQLCRYEKALKAYYLKTNTYPTTKQGLTDLVTQRIIRYIPIDPWGSQYQYRYIGKKDGEPFLLFSLGADKKIGGHGQSRDLQCKDVLY